MKLFFHLLTPCVEVWYQDVGGAKPVLLNLSKVR